MLAPHLLINVREMKEVEEGLGGGGLPPLRSVGRSSRGANRAGAEARNIAEMRLGKRSAWSVGRLTHAAKNSSIAAATQKAALPLPQYPQ